MLLAGPVCLADMGVSGSEGCFQFTHRITILRRTLAVALGLALLGLAAWPLALAPAVEAGATSLPARPRRVAAPARVTATPEESAATARPATTAQAATTTTTKAADLSAGWLHFSGHVTAAATGRPISGAGVFLNHQHFTTNELGYWSGDVPPAPRIDRWVIAPGYYLHRYWYADQLTGSNFTVSDALTSVYAADNHYSSMPGAIAPLVESVNGAIGGWSQSFPAGTRSITIAGLTGSAGGHALVSGQADLGLPSGLIRRVAVHVAAGRFAATFPLAQGNGRYRLEVNDVLGVAIINVPVFVGIPYQLRVPVPQPVGLSQPQLEQQALSSLNSIRAAHELPALNTDAGLRRVAQAHIGDWLSHQPPGASGWWCHCWSDGLGLAWHLQALRIPFHWAAEGVTFMSGAAGIAELYRSPAHRADLLGSYTHVGIVDMGASGRPYLVLEYDR